MPSKDKKKKNYTSHKPYLRRLVRQRNENYRIQEEALDLLTDLADHAIASLMEGAAKLRRATFPSSNTLQPRDLKTYVEATCKEYFARDVNDLAARSIALFNENSKREGQEVTETNT